MYRTNSGKLISKALPTTSPLLAKNAKKSHPLSPISKENLLNETNAYRINPISVGRGLNPILLTGELAQNVTRLPVIVAQGSALMLFFSIPRLIQFFQGTAPFWFNRSTDCRRCYCCRPAGYIAGLDY